LTVKEVNCPVCSKPGLELREVPYEVPGFGTMLIISMMCPHCGFKHRDVLCLEFGEPRRYEFVVEKPEDLKARVVRSSSATIRIPELGVLIEPGPMAEAFISNVEGVLERVENMIKMMLHLAETPLQRARAHEVLAKVWEAREGRFKFTLIIDDPLGNSLIAPPDKGKVKTRRLTEEEVRELKTGPFVPVDVRWAEAVELARSTAQEASVGGQQSGEKSAQEG